MKCYANCSSISGFFVFKKMLEFQLFLLILQLHSSRVHFPAALYSTRRYRRKNMNSAAGYNAINYGLPHIQFSLLSSIHFPPLRPKAEWQQKLHEPAPCSPDIPILWRIPCPRPVKNPELSRPGICQDIYLLKKQHFPLLLIPILLVETHKAPGKRG